MRESLCMVALASLLTGLPRLLAQGPKPTEYQVKAVYLYNFGRFVEWPSNAATPRSQPFAICVLGQDPLGPALDAALAGEIIDRAPVVAKRISRPEEPAQRAASYQTADVRLNWRRIRHFDLSVVGQNLLQPHHVEYGGDPGTLVGIKRSIFGAVTWQQ